jgi:hypothetical protein
MQREAGFYWLTWSGGEGFFVGEYEPRGENWGRHFDAIGLWKLTGTEDFYYVDPDGVCRDPDHESETLIEVVAGPMEPPVASGKFPEFKLTVLAATVIGKERPVALGIVSGTAPILVTIEQAFEVAEGIRDALKRLVALGYRKTKGGG